MSLFKKEWEVWAMTSDHHHYKLPGAYHYKHSALMVSHDMNAIALLSGKTIRVRYYVRSIDDRTASRTKGRDDRRGNTTLSELWEDNST